MELAGVPHQGLRRQVIPCEPHFTPFLCVVTQRFLIRVGPTIKSTKGNHPRGKTTVELLDNYLSRNSWVH